MGTYVLLSYSNSFRVSPTKHELDGIIKYPIVNKEPQKLKIVAHDAMMQFLQPALTIKDQILQNLYS